MIWTLFNVPNYLFCVCDSLTNAPNNARSLLSALIVLDSAPPTEAIVDEEEGVVFVVVAIIHIWVV